MGYLVTGGAFFACLLLARRSLVCGVLGVLVAGYGYGIIRANYLDTVTYFLFDGAVGGLYLGWLTSPRGPGSFPRLARVKRWVVILVGWSVIMFLIPLQHPLIQLVGLRSNAFLVPFLLLGGILEDREAGWLAAGVAGLNLVALGFGVAEYFLGVQHFYPLNAVTEVIYRSRDVAGFTAFRIPGTFAHAHGYAGTMLMTLPWLLGGILQFGLAWWRRLLLLGGLGAAVLGVFLSATRMPVVMLLVLAIVATFSGSFRASAWLSWVLILAGVGYLVSQEERLQRFMTLQDSEAVVERVQGSVNLSFVDLVVNHPMGNGLGAGGTSIPGFLQDLLSDPIGLENEYSRILLELGLVGLGLWIAFFAWLLLQPRPGRSHPWRTACLLIWWLSLVTVCTAMLGTGMMTAIPQSVLMFLGMGFMVTRRPAAASPAGGRQERDAHAPVA